jgi:4'-phosphopantetheinyl transferase
MVTSFAMQIDIWCAFCDRIADAVLLQQYTHLMTEAERSQEARFHFAEDRHRYRLTRALLRTTLSRYADIAPERWTFTANTYGRPSISNDSEAARRISFNLSHTRKLVVLAVTHDHELGIDTEDTATRSPPLEIADRFFAPDEVASLRALPAQQQLERFFQYWTLKESYIKARGMGLSLPLDQFAFHFPHPDRIRLQIQPQLQDDGERWRLWQWWVDERRQHMVALCAQRVEAQPPTILLQEVVPLASETPLQGALIASSP